MNLNECKCECAHVCVWGGGFGGPMVLSRISMATLGSVYVASAAHGVYVCVFISVISGMMLTQLGQTL